MAIAWINKATLSLFFVLFFTGVFGQQKRYISGGVMPGFLIAHRADLKNLAAHNTAFELAYEIDASESNWGKNYAKPVIGYNLLVYNIGKEETGWAYGGLVTSKFQLIGTQKSALNFRMGAGLSYLTKKFEVPANRRNQAIGSHLNGSMQFVLLYNHLMQRGYLEAGIGISHYSNAAFTMPNLGYNIPSIFLRYGRSIKPRTNSVTEFNPGSNYFNFTGFLIYGKKERNFANPQSFHNYGVQFRTLYSRNQVKYWRAGVDATVDKTYRFAKDPTYPLDSLKLNEKLEIGIAAGRQWRMNKLSIYVELGAYVYKPEVLKEPLYQRVGIGYSITEQLHTQGALKFHKGVADYFELGLGYRINK